MEKITLTAMRVCDTRIDYDFVVSPGLQKYFKSYHLFYQYDRTVANVPEGILAIPFLGTVMQVAWLADAEVEVDTVDAAFDDSLPRLRTAYRKMYPNCPLGGKLAAKTLQENGAVPAHRSAQLYTGGLDAVTTFIRHKAETPLLILEYGFYDETLFADRDYAGDEKSHRNFCSDKAAALQFAKTQGTEAAFIQANYGTFLNSNAINRDFAGKMGDNFWHGIHHAMALLGAAAPLAYREGVQTLHIASSFSVGNTYPCASDPTTDNEFRFANCQVHHDGYELTDQDKARLAVTYQKETKMFLPLRVCSWNDHNCCMCEKCMRRMLQLHAEGGDPACFGFSYKGSLLNQLQRFLDREVQFLSPKNVDKWSKIIVRMRENYDNVFDKDVADFLRDYDFAREKKRGLWRYYRRNFFSILKRKIKSLFTKGN